MFSTGEDLWHVYNLVRTGDLVTATTFRKIQRESGAGQESEKVKLKLSIRVETIDFDPEGTPHHALSRTSTVGSA